MKDLRLVSGYDVLYGKVKAFVQGELFDRPVELESPNTLRNLSELAATKTLIETFKKAINALTVRDKGDAEIRDTIKLRQTRPFVAKDQGYLVPKKSVFNRIIGDSHVGTAIRRLSGRVQRRSLLREELPGRPFQTRLRERGRRHFQLLPGFYGQAVRRADCHCRNEGAGRDLDVPLKMARLRQWCEDINRVQNDVKYDFVYVDQESFEQYKPVSFKQLVDGFKEYKDGK